MKLEELARTSADAARSSVRTLEPPTIGERARPGWAVPVMTGAAVTALVVGGLLLIDRHQDDPGPADQPVATVPEELPVPRLALADDSWRATFATDGSDLQDFPIPRFDYYGDASAERPFAEDDLLIAWGEDDGTEEPSGVTTTVRGVDGALASGEDAGFGSDVTTLTWQDASGLSIILASHHADGDRLVAIADGLLVDTATGTVAPDPSIGLERVGSDTGTPFMAPRGNTEGTLVAYESVEVADLSAVVSSRRGELGEAVRAAEWWLGAPAEVALADDIGHEFDYTSLFGGDGQTGRLLLWEPARGSTAQLIVSGPETDVDLATLADSVVELDDAAWADMRDVRATPNADGMDVLYGDGSGEIDGVAYAWSLGEQGGDRCFSLSTGDSGLSSCQDGLEAPAAPSVVDQGSNEELAYAIVRVGPEQGDEVVEATGTFLIERVDAAGATWFVAIGPGDVAPLLQVLSEDEVVATLEAGVPAEEAAMDTPEGPDPAIADHPSAVELGVENMDIVFHGGDDRLSLWVGTQDDDLCLVVDGAAISASCRPVSDVTVFRTDDTPEVDTLVVVMRDLPECIVSVGTSGPGASAQASSGSRGHTYQVAWGGEPVSEWAVHLVDADGAERMLDLPDGVDESTAEFPDDLCP